VYSHDQFTRRVIGFGVHAGDVDGTALCCMFARAITGQGEPRYLSSDHDPLFEYQRWEANLRVLQISEVKTVPRGRRSHPIVEPPIGTIRKEYLGHIFFWSTADLERKLTEFGNYYNRHRVHSSLDGQTPAEISWERANAQAALQHFHWQTHCRGSYELPVAA